MDSYVSPAISSILGVVDTHLRWKNLQSKGERSYKNYHPSEWGHCLRRQQYKHYVSLGLLTVEEEGFNSQTLRLFDKGHNMHDRWAKYFEDIGVLRGVWVCKNPQCHQHHGKEDIIGIFKPKSCDKCGNDSFFYNEISVVSEEFRFVGHADQILDFSNFDHTLYGDLKTSFNPGVLPRHPVLVDMKTCNDFGFKNYVKKTGPHHEYITQLTIYIHILGIPFGLLIYENKNNSDLAFFQVNQDEEAFDIVKKQSLLMQSMVDKRVLPPPKPKDQDDRECKRCEFKSHCHSSKIWSDPELDIKRDNFYKKGSV